MQQLHSAPLQLAPHSTACSTEARLESSACSGGDSCCWPVAMPAQTPVTSKPHYAPGRISRGPRRVDPNKACAVSFVPTQQEAVCFWSLTREGTRLVGSRAGPNRTTSLLARGAWHSPPPVSICLTLVSCQRLVSPPSLISNDASAKIASPRQSWPPRTS